MKGRGREDLYKEWIVLSVSGRRELYKQDDPYMDPCKVPGCKFASVKGSLACSRHGGASEARANNSHREMNYQFKRYQTQLEAGVRKANMNDLREEISLTRIMVETIVNHAEDDISFLAMIPSLNPLISTLDRLITNNAKLEAFFGQFMTPEQVDTMVSSILDILIEEIQAAIPDEAQAGALLGRLSERIGEATTLIEGTENLTPMLG